MHRRLQFGMRESPASSRRHGSRLTAESATNENSIKEENLTTLKSSPSHVYPTDGPNRYPHPASLHAAIGGGTRDDGRLMTVHEVAELLQVPASWVYERKRRRGLEQLPHLKIGKYLRFDESALAEFIRRQSRA
jgi:excisionase family DNA binding protein